MATKSTKKNIGKKEHRAGRPEGSYVDIISEILQSAPYKKLVLKDIYRAISKKYPFYDMKNTWWQNSIRHNLTLSSKFKKVSAPGERARKGGFWTLTEDSGTVKKEVKSDEVPLDPYFMECAPSVKEKPKTEYTSIVFTGDLRFFETEEEILERINSQTYKI